MAYIHAPDRQKARQLHQGPDRQNPLPGISSVGKERRKDCVALCGPINLTITLSRIGRSVNSTLRGGGKIDRDPAAADYLDLSQSRPACADDDFRSGARTRRKPWMTFPAPAHTAKTRSPTALFRWRIRE